MQPDDFIAMIASDAQKLQHDYGIFASVVIAQAALETGWGKFIPVDKYTGKQSYNLFGIKGEGTIGNVRCDTKEFENGRWLTIEDDFRAYNSYYESLVDHSQFLLSPRYTPVRNAGNGEEAAMQLFPCGYATDPNYGAQLVSIQKSHNLYQYDILIEYLYAVYQDNNHLRDFYDYASAVGEAKKWTDSNIRKISDGSWVWTNISEDDEPMKLADWEFEMLVNALKDLKEKGFFTSDDWIEKAQNRTLTASELAFLNTILIARKLK